MTELTDWDLYRKCSQVCGAETGQPCFSRNGKVVEGRPDGVRTELKVPHTTRKMRSRAARSRAAS